MKQTNIPQGLEAELASNGDALAAQNAAAVCRRHEAYKRWEERLTSVRAGTLAVGALKRRISDRVFHAAKSEDARN